MFYVEDQLNPGWSIVLVSPHGDYNDTSNEDDLGDTILDCHGVTKRLPPIETFDVMCENDQANYARVDCRDEGIWIDST